MTRCVGWTHTIEKLFNAVSKNFQKIKARKGFITLKVFRFGVISFEKLLNNNGAFVKDTTKI